MDPNERSVRADGAFAELPPLTSSHNENEEDMMDWFDDGLSFELGSLSEPPLEREMDEACLDTSLMSLTMLIENGHWDEFQKRCENDDEELRTWAKCQNWRGTPEEFVVATCPILLELLEQGGPLPLVQKFIQVLRKKAKQEMHLLMKEFDKVGQQIPCEEGAPTTQSASLATTSSSSSSIPAPRASAVASSSSSSHLGGTDDVANEKWSAAVLLCPDKQVEGQTWKRRRHALEVVCGIPGDVDKEIVSLLIEQFPNTAQMPCAGSEEQPFPLGTIVYPIHVAAVKRKSDEIVKALSDAWPDAMSTPAHIPTAAGPRFQRSIMDESIAMMNDLATAPVDLQGRDKTEAGCSSAASVGWDTVHGMTPFDIVFAQKCGRDVLRATCEQDFWRPRLCGRRDLLHLFCAYFNVEHEGKKVQDESVRATIAMEKTLRVFPNAAKLAKPFTGNLPIHALFDGSVDFKKDWKLPEIRRRPHRALMKIRMLDALQVHYPEGVRTPKRLLQELPLHMACRKDDSSHVIEHLMTLYPEGACQQDRYGRTPLQHYVPWLWKVVDLRMPLQRRVEPRVDIAYLLAGKNPEAMFRKSVCPPHAMKHHEGSLVDLVHFVSQINQRRSKKLRRARRFDMTERLSVERLLEVAYPTGLADNTTGHSSPFHLACSYGSSPSVASVLRTMNRMNRKAVRTLTNVKAFPAESGSQKDLLVDRLPLHIACATANGASLEVVLELVGFFGGAVEVTDSLGMLPFEIACLNSASCLDVLYVLLRECPTIPLPLSATAFSQGH